MNRGMILWQRLIMKVREESYKRVSRVGNAAAHWLCACFNWLDDRSTGIPWSRSAGTDNHGVAGSVGMVAHRAFWFVHFYLQIKRVFAKRDAQAQQQKLMQAFPPPTPPSSNQRSIIL
jgi:hypothetical protein